VKTYINYIRVKMLSQYLLKDGVDKGSD